MEKIARMTLEGISAEIGISRTTIYKVLKNKGNVSERTRETVMEALEKYHYVQNRNARNLALNRRYPVGYAGFRSRSANYFSPKVREGIERAIREFGDDGLEVFFAEFDVERPGRQTDEVERLLRQGVRSFVLAFADEAVIGELLHRLRKEGCRVVLLSRDWQEDGGDYYVGVDYYRSGLLAAELLGKILPGESLYAAELWDNGFSETRGSKELFVQKRKIFIPVTREYESNRDIHARLRGFLDKLKGFPACEILPVKYGLVEEEQVYREVVSCVEREPNLAGIFDLTYRLDVTARALRDLGRTDIRLVGFDLFQEIEQDIADCVIDAVVYQDLSSQAYLAVKLLFEEMCYGITHEKKKFYSKQEIITGENLCYFGKSEWT